ncbi:hypothetical protein MGYG_04452 [Nannizzia gypsea CBS 118893]|uniref:Uncharacterized protein n=1 Tax=Arthroderma gypseum (strain ATCC MYA-4604 / CBS 118893) TaxID=535722 RepID=E4UT49_ARTGP|nr:hypothetical protein MGYG_04452 [Nannizzia gypsea CBS 118893]EFR01445.1 hypothetical protein MGYG_04452 [Nannizzia gypsea CBS 118893]
MPGLQQAVNGAEDVGRAALMVEQRAQKRQAKMSLSREFGDVSSSSFWVFDLDEGGRRKGFSLAVREQIRSSGRGDAPTAQMNK